MSFRRLGPVEIEPYLVYNDRMLHMSFLFDKVSQMARGIYHTHFPLAWNPLTGNLFYS